MRPLCELWPRKLTESQDWVREEGVEGYGPLGDHECAALCPQIQWGKSNWEAISWQRRTWGSSEEQNKHDTGIYEIMTHYVLPTPGFPEFLTVFKLEVFLRYFRFCYCFIRKRRHLNYCNMHLLGNNYTDACPSVLEWIIACIKNLHVCISHSVMFNSLPPYGL